MKNVFICTAFLVLCASICKGQTKQYNLYSLFNDHQLVYDSANDAVLLKDADKQGISVRRIVWLKNVTFSKGAIDIDLRGKNVFQQSFLGIAFYGVDTLAYDCIYFRPFNFQSPDTLRKKHTVQYMSEPNYPWDKLRNEHPLVYENQVNPELMPTAWFHAHIVVNDKEIIVYVNHSKIPSLTVKKLTDRKNGLVGLWNAGLNGDFANLEINNTP